MSRPPAALPPDLGDLFTSADARRAGVTRGRLGARDLDAPFRGVRTRRLPPAPPDDGPLALDRAQRARVLGLARAYAAVAPPGAFFVERTAAVLHGCPIRHPPDALDVGVLAPARAPRARGIRGVKVTPHLVTIAEVDGLPVVSAASAWAMLARSMSVRELVIVGDALVVVPRGPGGQRMPQAQRCTPLRLSAAAAAGPRRGVARLRDALSHIREGAMSPPESELRLDLTAAGLAEPALDVEIRARGGQLLGITELVYPDHRVAIEVEGDHHRTSRWQWDRDLEKYAAYAEAGWTVVRVSAAQIRSGRGVEIVAAALSRASPRPTGG